MFGLKKFFKNLWKGDDEGSSSGRPIGDQSATSGSSTRLSFSVDGSQRRGSPAGYGHHEGDPHLLSRYVSPLRTSTSRRASQQNSPPNPVGSGAPQAHYTFNCDIRGVY